MKTWKFAAPLIVCLLILNVAHGKPKKPELPAVFETARYVYVEAEAGDMFKPSLFPEDRQAIADVQDSLRRWNRYALTTNRSEAELVFVVRKGRLAEGQLQGGISGGPVPPRGQTQPGQNDPAANSGPGQPRGGPYFGAGSEVGPPDDMLRVYIQNEGHRSSKVWDRSMDGGLDAPSVRLMQQLKEAVERAYPQPPPTSNKP